MIAVERVDGVTDKSGIGPETSGKSTPDDLLAVAVRVAREAAATARRMRDGAIVDVQTKSTETDPVTAADRAVERQVVAALRDARPGDSVLGEEYGDATG